MEFPAPPTSVSLTRSVAAGDVEFGSSITYTCTSSGGYPIPTVDFFPGSGTAVATGEGPLLTHVLVADDTVKDVTMKCVASNSQGSVEDTDILTIFCKHMIH